MITMMKMIIANDDDDNYDVGSGKVMKMEHEERSNHNNSELEIDDGIVGTGT
jgi:hypothetical protein